jgi:hypothetical protein
VRVLANVYVRVSVVGCVRARVYMCVSGWGVGGVARAGAVVL